MVNNYLIINYKDKSVESRKITLTATPLLDECGKDEYTLEHHPAYVATKIAKKIKEGEALMFGNRVNLRSGEGVKGHAVSNLEIMLVIPTSEIRDVEFKAIA